MDAHRCRFVPYPASAVNALAFSHASTPWKKGPPPPSTLRLALGRANGDIEIWNPAHGFWAQETILRGGADRSIEGLAWTHDLEDDAPSPEAPPQAGKLRLFSIGYSAVITEWDLVTGRPLRHSSGNYGQIWCLSAQPRWTADSQAREEGDVRGNQHLAVGCADGSIALHATADDDLAYLKTLPRPSNPKARVLSLAFHGRTMVVAGYSDSTIRRFRTTGRGALLQEMSLGSSGAKSKGGASATLVWAVRPLDAHAVASGDSTGEIKIWDTRTATMLQRIQSHRADILDLAVSADGSLLMSAGIDRRTTVYRRSAADRDRWTETSHRRVHRNDVKALAAYEAKSLSIVVSGGLWLALVGGSQSSIALQASMQHQCSYHSGNSGRRTAELSPAFQQCLQSTVLPVKDYS